MPNGDLCRRKCPYGGPHHDNLWSRRPSRRGPTANAGFGAGIGAFFGGLGFIMATPGVWRWR